jgi:hypothetical protein
MVRFLEENGFPMTLILDTDFNYYDPKTEFKGYYTKVTDAAGNIVGEFAHKDLRGRIHWVNGFFTALKLRNGI